MTQAGHSLRAPAVCSRSQRLRVRWHIGHLSQEAEHTLTPKGPASNQPALRPEFVGLNLSDHAPLGAPHYSYPLPTEYHHPDSSTSQPARAERQPAPQPIHASTITRPVLINGGVGFMSTRGARFGCQCNLLPTRK